MQHEMRLIDTNGHTVPGAVRYGVPTDQVATVETELKALAGPDAHQSRELHLAHAASLTGVSASNQRAAASQIRANHYEVRITPPVA
ncbi:hypothetical protein [Streptomyces javensis]|uniref:Uncharacterized protein n=1 Tax=Streptomyces javensis TaxID=114698 RepID=A0ABS0RBH6_9ACTN|nr:hypothetical protein [Streptomyces javensis]MBI0314742.1 hypothetical protein [Streptomyces javensis]